VLVCGVIAWAVYALDIPQPFKTIAIAVLLVVVLVILFSVLGVHTGIPVN
jgi:heme A synthase